MHCSHTVQHIIVCNYCVFSGMVDCNLPKIVAKEPGSKVGRRLVLREEKSEMLKDVEF
jgi:hypothetical protein